MRRSTRLASRNFSILNNEELEYITRLITANPLDNRNITINTHNGTTIYVSRNDINTVLEYRQNQESNNSGTQFINPRSFIHPDLLNRISSENNQGQSNSENNQEPINSRNLRPFINPDLLNRISQNVKKSSSEYEEDSEIFDFTVNTFAQNEKENDIKNCANDSLITLENYKDDETPIMIYILNSINKFEKAICMTQYEWNNHLQSDRLLDYPTNIMCIATSPADYNISGVGSKPTKNVIIKLPHNQLYVTLGSAIRINQEYNINKIWYAFPLYNNIKRRIINTKGVFGSSMNHGQIPGFKIYKLLRRDEIKQNANIKELPLDYPRYTDNKSIEKDDLNKILDSCISEK